VRSRGDAREYTRILGAARGNVSVTTVSKRQEDAMDLGAVAGVSRVAVVVGVLVGVGLVFVLARVLARRSSRPERTIVSFGSDRS